ncbi:MAG TPA: lysophospholipid acyltransferase family protein [Vicinamibacteria bacterium]|nr:lysophospholipid acyltransferase family protein [Vicinamibacteria bacterium]
MRALRSGAFLAVYLVHMLLTFGAVQRFVVWPLALLWPARRRDIVGWWFRFQAHLTLAMARVLANVRVTTQGAIEPGSCVVVMNHQSVLDIPIAYALVRRPYPLIPTRARYRYGMPAVSPLIRLGRLPLVRQEPGSARGDVKSMQAAAERVARGEHSLLIFAEGHRTRDGEIGPFMRTGLKVVLARAHRPVYCVVEDGLWHVRTFADVCLRFADSSAEVVVLGPFEPPAAAEIEAFIESLRERMVTTLREMRARRQGREGTAA